MSDTCRQELSQWEEPCPLETVPDEDYCYLHLSPSKKGDQQVRDAIQEYFALDHPVIADAKIDALTLDDELFADLLYNDVKFYNCEIETLRLSDFWNDSSYDFAVSFLDCEIGQLQAIEYDHYGELRFQGGSIETLVMVDVTFHSSVRFLSPIRAGGKIERSTFEDALQFGFDYHERDDERAILLGECEIARLAGELASRQVPLVLEGGTIGGVEHVDFERTCFKNVVFDGVDFAALETHVRNSRTALFEIDADLEETAIEPFPILKKNTYQKARAGASATGASSMASYFFRREKIYNRHEHARRARKADSVVQRARAAESWLANLALGGLTGHGQIPRRVVASSVAIVFAFSGLFYLIGPRNPYGSPLGYLIVSVESFVTLVLSSEFTFDSEWVRLLAEVEGFVGVFMTGLFIFTLTRSLQH